MRSSIALAALSILLNLFFLAAAIYIYRTPAARQHVDRVSYRLMLWIAPVEVLYSVCYVVLYANPAVCRSPHLSLALSKHAPSLRHEYADVSQVTAHLGTHQIACGAMMTLLLGSRHAYVFPLKMCIDWREGIN